MNIKAIKIDVYIKFVEEKYMDQTINNGIFFNKLEIFKKSDGLMEGQFDYDEGAKINFKKPPKLEILDKNFKKVGSISGSDILNFKLKKSFNFASETPITCFSRLRYPYDFTFVKIKRGVYEFKVKDKIIRDLSDIGGNRPYIFLSGKELIESLNNEIKKGKRILAQKVNYYKAEGENITDSELEKNPYKIIFMKNEIYKNQKEFRIALLDKKEKGYYKIPNLDIEKSEKLDNLRLYMKKVKSGELAVQIAEEDENLFENFRNL